MLSATFSATASTVSLLSSLIRPTTENISINGVLQGFVQ